MKDCPTLQVAFFLEFLKCPGNRHKVCCSLPVCIRILLGLSNLLILIDVTRIGLLERGLSQIGFVTFGQPIPAIIALICKHRNQFIVHRTITKVGERGKPLIMIRLPPTPSRFCDDLTGLRPHNAPRPSKRIRANLPHAGVTIQETAGVNRGDRDRRFRQTRSYLPGLGVKKGGMRF